jgi:hypothetical protein
VNHRHRLIALAILLPLLLGSAARLAGGAMDLGGIVLAPRRRH